MVDRDGPRRINIRQVVKVRRNVRQIGFLGWVIRFTLEVIPIAVEGELDEFPLEVRDTCPPTLIVRYLVIQHGWVPWSVSRPYDMG